MPWAQIIALRHRLIHTYDRVDLDIIWQIASADLPALVGQLDAILGGESV